MVFVAATVDGIEFMDECTFTVLFQRVHGCNADSCYLHASVPLYRSTTFLPATSVSFKVIDSAANVFESVLFNFLHTFSNDNMLMYVHMYICSCHVAGSYNIQVRYIAIACRKKVLAT